MSSTQKEIFETAAQPIIESVLEGFNGTIFAYGQTSSGKTYTMQGDLYNPDEEGITPRMIRHVFNYFATSNSDLEFTVKVSLFEIHMEKINDLIQSDRTNLNIREDPVKGVYIEDLTEHYVCSEEEVLEFMKAGSSNRATAKTNMNEHSSRSHLIFLMTIHQTNIKSLISKTGRLFMVDLAGSEKISKTGATGMTLEEAKNINKSLTTLGMVINNLTDGKSLHIPYRDSKLTRLLQESIGGNSKTRLIITCSPSAFNEQETLSTLRFGNRAKKIKNKPIINKEVTVAELKLEVDKLEKLLLICNARVTHLDGFIKNNNLYLPEEDELIFGKWEKKIKESISKVEGSDIKAYSGNRNNHASIQSNSKNDFFTLGENKEDGVNNGLKSEVDKKIIKELNDKHKDLVEQYNILESDKNMLSEQYDEALKRNREFLEIINEKEEIIKEMKKKSLEGTTDYHLEKQKIIEETRKACYEEFSEILKEKEKFIEEIKEKFYRELKEKENIIAEKEKVIEEINTKSNKEFAEILKEKDKILADKEKMIEEIKTKSNKEFSEILKEKEKILREKEKMIEDIKTKSYRDFSKVVQEKERIMQEKEKVLQEKEKIFQEKELIIREKEKVIEEIKLKSKSYSEVPEEVFTKLKIIFSKERILTDKEYLEVFNELFTEIKNSLYVKFNTIKFLIYENKISEFNIVQKDSFDVFGSEKFNETIHIMHNEINSKGSLYTSENTQFEKNLKRAYDSTDIIQNEKNYHMSVFPYDNVKNGNNEIESVISMQLISKINSQFLEQEFKKLKSKFSE